MRRIGWLLQLGPPAVMVAAIAFGSVFGPGRLKVAAAASLRSCPAQTSFVASVAQSARTAPIDALVSLRPRLGQAGDAVGQTLAVSGVSMAARSLELAAESFASPPMGNVLVFGQRETAGSKVRALDLETGCEFGLTSTSDAVRSAVLSQDLDALYVHSVSSADRADRGVRRIDLATGASRVVVPALASAEPFGTTFATILRWSVGGDELAVQSCGIARCRTRVLDVGSGRIQLIADPRHEQLVGLTAERLFAFDTCHSRPCPLLAIDRQTAVAHELATDVFSARLVESAGAAAIAIDTPAGTREIRP